MRQKKLRVILTGGGLVAVAVAFFLFFLSIAAKSNNPSELMRTVGTFSGVAIGIGVAMIAIGMVGKEA